MPVDLSKFDGTAKEGFKTEDLDTQKEFVFELIGIDIAENVSTSFKGTERVVNRLKTEWQVVGTDTKVWQFFNLPASINIKAGAPLSYSEKSKFVIFARQIRRVHGENPDISLSKILPIGLRIRGFLIKGKDADGKDSGYYHIELGSVGADAPASTLSPHRRSPGWSGWRA